MRFDSHQHISMETNQNSERRAIDLKWTLAPIFKPAPEGPDQRHHMAGGDDTDL